MKHTKHYLPVTADFFRERWVDSGLRITELAQRCGYKNVTKGVNKIQRFFERGFVHEQLFTKLTAALEIDDDTVRQLHADDYTAWCAWADEPVRPYLVLRIMPAIYCPIELPEEITTHEEAEEFAAAFAAKQHKLVALVWSRRLTIYFDANGERHGSSEARPGVPNSPFTIIGGKKIVH